MAAAKSKSKTKTATRAMKEKIRKAQDAGGLSSVAVSHVSKATILKKFRSENNEQPESEADE